MYSQDLSQSQSSQDPSSEKSQTPPNRKSWRNAFPRKRPCFGSLPTNTKKTRLPTNTINDCSVTVLKRRIVELERQLHQQQESCPTIADKKGRALASSGICICTRCGMSHRKAQIYNIGKRIYGSDPKKQRDKWIKDGTKECLVTT